VSSSPASATADLKEVPYSSDDVEPKVLCRLSHGKRGGGFGAFGG